MFTVSVETHFWASHQLALPDGSKEPLHRHNWQITVEVSSDRLNTMGVVMDFCWLKATVKKIVGGLSNTALEEKDYFRQNNSSAEAVAKYVYDKLEPKLPKGVKLDAVTVVEEPGCRAKYRK